MDYFSINSDWWIFGGLFAILFHLLGFAAALVAIFKTRTSQGAIAWAIALIAFPVVTLPLYLLLGRNKFHGYVHARRTGDKQLATIVDQIRHKILTHPDLVYKHQRDELKVLEALAGAPFTTHNLSRLLINGDACFDAIFEGIESAKQYILIQFYIVRDDELGQRFKKALLKKAAEGVKVYFLYDEVGSHNLPHQFKLEMMSGGVEMHAFGTPKNKVNRFHLNFRNHRKVVIIDGQEAYVGGLNIGIEYLGKSKRGKWRDTHARIAGPAVKKIQLTFLEDWYWATHEVPIWNWDFAPDSEGKHLTLAVPSGPADSLETCCLFYIHLINTAKKRVWIASPYFIPNGAVIAALQSAALRGVDVRILIPNEPDHVLVYFAAYSYLDDTIPVGVKVYKYNDGFLHSKVVLVDDEFSVVGTANFDNRSFRLNFEISVVTIDGSFTKQVEAMFDEDFSKSRLLNMDEIDAKPVYFRLMVQIARLFSPIL